VILSRGPRLDRLPVGGHPHHQICRPRDRPDVPIWRMLDPSSSPSASLSTSNILRWLASPQKSPINTGLRAQTSGLQRTSRDPKFSLSGPFFSKAPDCANLVRIPQAIDIESFFVGRTSGLFERSLGAPGATGIQRNY